MKRKKINKEIILEIKRVTKIIKNLTSITDKLKLRILYYLDFEKLASATTIITEVSQKKIMLLFDKKEQIYTKTYKEIKKFFKKQADSYLKTLIASKRSEKIVASC
ncbi:hypothetical protein CDIK_2292 [Cucumispora dikerogammari]|nr:hypothetical protein CDIK_2292 [Cucumispora dikerogammari]